MLARTKQAINAGRLLIAVAVTYVMGSCAVPIDEDRRDARVFAARGAIRGSFRYQGPPPCSLGGRIVGTGIILVWDKANLPPPLGRATRPVNFAAIPGDSLFPDRPRYTGTDALSCPNENESLIATVPFAISPLEPGAYYLTAFFNRSGNYLPAFSVRNMPEAGDLLGGYLDAEEQQARGSEPNYIPRLYPIEIGYPDPVPAGQPSSFVPTYRIPATGFVASNISITLGQRAVLGRPYFHVAGAQAPAQAPEASPQNPAADPWRVPVLRMTQDHQVLAAPARVSAASSLAQERSYVALRVEHGLPFTELADAINPAKPFVFQLAPPAVPKSDGFAVFLRAAGSPESANIASVWPEFGFLKLVDDPKRVLDPTGSRVQAAPRVLISALTLWEDALASTVDSAIPKRPVTARDHVRILARPAALCYSPNRSGVPGVVVVPNLIGASADSSELSEKPLFDSARLLASTQGLASTVRRACLPLGRYALTAAYPTGQTWTTPNESGGCSDSEGVVVGNACSLKSRPVLLSQGQRAVLEIVPPTTEAGRAFCLGVGAPPMECQAQ
jgi:hypothetical protein